MQTIRIYHGEKALSVQNEAYDLYSMAWKNLHHLIESKMDTISRSIFDKLIQYIDESHSSIDSKKQTSCEPSEFTEVAKQIPTALLLAGVNTPDHKLVYERIRTSVLARRGHVAIVNPGSETISSRSLVSAVVQQFLQRDNSGTEMQQLMTMSSDSDDDNVDNVVRMAERDVECGDDFMKQFTPSVRFTYWALNEWYHRNRSHKPYPQPHGHIRFDSKRTSRRSLSQPDPDRLSKSKRVLRSSLLPQTPNPPRRKDIATRRFTSRPDVSFIRNGELSACSPPSSTADEVHPVASTGPLVIILPQIEAIPTPVLQDFIELTSVYVSGGHSGGNALPICLVLGLSTSPEVGFEARLNASTLSRLRVEWFTVPPPAVFLDAVFGALLDFPGFHLNQTVCTYLVDSLFLCLDYSVQNFIRRLQFCMLEHYLNIPHPKLLLPSDEASAYLKSLSSTTLASMVSLDFPSLSSFATKENSPPWPLAGHEGKASRLTDRLSSQLEAHWHLQYIIGPVLKWFLSVISPITTAPLGRTVSELYRHWLKDGLVNSEEFTVIRNLLGGLSKSTLLEALEKAAIALEAELVEQRTVIIIKGAGVSWPESVRNLCQERLSELLRSTRDWLTVLRNATTTLNVGPINSSPQTNQSPSAQKLNLFESGKKRKMNLQELRQHLQEVAAASPRSASQRALQSEWEQKRGQFLEWLTGQLPDLIPCPTSLPLHEVFYGPFTSDLTVLRRRFNPPYQRCLHQALMDPGLYLQLPELQIDNSDTMDPKLPDISILYKLHLESSTKLINLHDWLVAFATILGDNVDDDNPPSELIQARFFHGIAQLHHMGYIKATKRKADHVMRLTWGLSV